MRKLAIILAVVVLTVALSSCGQTPEEIAYEKWQTEQLIAQKDKERAAQVELARIAAEAEARKTPEQRTAEAQTKAQAEQTALMEKQADSLKYLENSKKVHDTVQAVGFGLSVISALSK